MEIKEQQNGAIMNNQTKQHQKSDTGCALLAIACVAVGFATTAQAQPVTYDYDGLTGSPFPGTAISGQDNWTTTTTNAMEVRNDLSTRPGFSGNVASSPTDNAESHRLNDANFSFGFTGPDIRLSNVVRLRSNSFAATGFFADGNNNGSAQSNESSASFGVRNNGFIIRKAAQGTVIEDTEADIIGTGEAATQLWELVFDIDLDANSGDGSGSLSARYLGDDDGSFNPGTGFDDGNLNTIVGLQNVDLNMSAMVGDIDTDTLGLRIRRTGAASDNFTLATIPEPSTYALIGGLAVLGLALLRRNRSRG